MNILVSLTTSPFPTNPNHWIDFMELILHCVAPLPVILQWLSTAFQIESKLLSKIRLLSYLGLCCPFSSWKAGLQMQAQGTPSVLTPRPVFSPLPSTNSHRLLTSYSFIQPQRLIFAHWNHTHIRLKEEKANPFRFLQRETKNYDLNPFLFAIIKINVKHTHNCQRLSCPSGVIYAK